MGMGEPLHNFDNVTRALALLDAPLGRGVLAAADHRLDGGLVPAIEKLGALYRRPPNLAISLNATTDEVRDRIMPDQQALADRGAAGGGPRAFRSAHGRRVTFEYVLLAGVNDSDADADRLPRLLARHPGQGEPHPLEPVRRAREFARPSAERIRTFQERLRAARRRRLHPHAARRRHRRRLRAARGRPRPIWRPSGQLAGRRTI